MVWAKAHKDCIFIPMCASTRTDASEAVRAAGTRKDHLQ